ncbi:MAG: hypothetical protein DRG83_11800, partial [Deltaproteobacteria bacterium]
MEAVKSTVVSVEDIECINNIDRLREFFLKLGYKSSPQLLDVEGFDFSRSAKKLLKEFYIIADYGRRFQIYFAKISSMRRTDFRIIIESFYRRYPQVNVLFIFTQDWNEIAFVSPERVAVEPGRVKIRLRILLVDPKNVYHTDLEVLNNIAISADEQNPDIIWQKHREAFNVERVTKDFFEAYKSALRYIRNHILLPQRKAPYQEAHSFAQQLLSRIMFLYYVQKKGWLKWRDYEQDKRYIKHLWEKYRKSNAPKDTFYSIWLCSLFFQAFNKKPQYITPNLPDDIKESFSLMPFLNGGLFTENELDKIGFKVPDSVFEVLFETDPFDKRKGFLERYNFTVREDTPLDVEVAVDPEMLGKVYESLISEEERGKAGIFYTPRLEIDYMCRMSLVEYLAEETGITKQCLIPMIFEPQRVLENGHLKPEDLRKIKHALDKVRIVDPAVGSASFLVGMMNVLVEIHQTLTKRLENREENLFALKNKILQENLYGVDVKDWAVMVGELRLWLSLIIETEEKYMDIYTKPLLPNLTFKIRQGDSLVEEIAGIPVSLRGEFTHIPQNIKEKIAMLVDKKSAYFAGRRSADLKEKEEIERLENEIFRDIIQNEIEKLKIEKQEIEKSIPKQPTPNQMFEESEPERKKSIERQLERVKGRLKGIEQRKEQLTKLLDTIKKKKQKDYFLWEIDFAEVFAEKGGFDIVIGNPPYVRQEKIAFPLEREEDYKPDEWRQRKRLYKEKLAQSVKLHWGDSVKIDKKSDLYVYFYYHGLALLRPGGVFCFVNSNSWLDVDYGTYLQEFLLKNMQPIYIVDNLIKRTFKESDVNTVIVLIKKPKRGISLKDTTKFVAFKKPFEAVLKSDVLVNVENAKGRVYTGDYRVCSMTREELLEEGVKMQKEERLDFKNITILPYVGNKWGGKYLRAPDIYFRILEKGKGKLVKLGDIAEIRFGIKTGANEFFYLPSKHFDIKKEGKYYRLIPKHENLPHDLMIEEEFLKPVIKSPRELRTIVVKPEDLKYKVFMCHKSKAQL